MLTPMRRRSSRLARAALALATLAALAAAGSACGGGGQPGAVVSTLTPSAVATAAATGTPSPGTTAKGTARPSSGPTAASTATPGSAGSASASPAAITDAGIRADLLRRLGASPTLVGLEIRVRVVHRVVYLSGTVKTKAEKTAAEHIAVTEPDIAKVESLIEIVPGGGGY